MGTARRGRAGRRLAVALACACLTGCAVVGWPGSSIRGCVESASAPTENTPGSADAITLVALGDFGTAEEGRNVEVAAALEAWMAARPAPTAAVVLLGDNFYPSGLIGRDRGCLPWRNDIDVPALRQQVEEVLGPFGFLRQRTVVYAMPGNHDYGCLRLGSLANQAKIDDWAEREWGESWQLRAGLPTALGYGDILQLVFLDSTRMIEDREFLEGSAAALDRLLQDGAYRWRIVAAHHPLYANGAHDGAWWEGTVLKALYLPSHLLILPPLLYGHQQVYEWRYRRYRHTLEAVFARRHVDLLLAGHEHALELLAAAAAGQPLNVISGAGAQCSNVMRRTNTIFGASKNGFAAITATRQRLQLDFIGTTACAEAGVCAQSDRPGGWHRLYRHEVITSPAEETFIPVAIELHPQQRQLLEPEESWTSH